MRSLPALALLLLAACAGVEADPRVEDGRAVAEAECAACHAIGPTRVSPNPAAPPFQGILRRYRPDALSEDLINGIQIAHAMPEFQFNPQVADSLIAYLRYVQEEEEEVR